ncbi:hypothetical protein Tco_0779851 [Tanacetum coccineum]
MGYEEDLTTLTFQKALFSPQWKYLIHTIIHCLSSKSTSWDQFPTNVASAVICLATDRTFNFSKMIFDGMNRNLEAKKKFLMYPRFVQVFLNNQLQNIPAPLDNLPIPVLSKKVFTNMTRRGLHFSGHVTPLFSTMLVPAAVEEGEGLGTHTEPQPTPSPTQPSVGDQTHVTESSSRPENTQNSRKTLEGSGGSDGDQELFVICTNLSNRVLALETSKNAQATQILKLKTRIKKMKKKCKPSISHHKAWLRSVSILSMKKKLGKKESVLEKGGNNEEQVNAAGNIGVSTTVPKVSTVNISTTSRPEVSTVTPMTPPTTISYLASEFDEIPSKDECRYTDHELAVRWTQEEQEKYTVDERAKLLAEYFENRKKQLAEERAAAIRNKPLTKSQLRSLMMTYLKHTGRYKHAQLNKKTLEEIQVLYIKEQERIADFVPIGSEEDERLIQKMNKKVAGVHEEKVLEEPDSTKVEVKQEGNKESTRKRPGRRLKMKATKKSRMQKTDSDLEEEEHLKTFLKLVPDEEGIIDYEVLEKRFPIINWESKFYHLDRHGAECIYYRIFRSDESSRWIKTFSEMVTMFDRLDLEELYNLVMQRFESTTPEGVDLVLWGDLRTMFDANAEDDIWKNQEEWILRSWNFYENCRVHTLILEDGTEIHMLAERKYPLTKETLKRMLSLKLIAESASESTYNLLRHQELASPEQTASRKDFSNLLMANS